MAEFLERKPGPKDGQTSVLEALVARGELDHGGTLSSWVNVCLLLRLTRK